MRDRLTGPLKILAADTALQACSAALWSDGHIVARRWEPLARGHAERLAPMIADLLAEAGETAAAMDRLAVTIGPGGFTGQRVGLSLMRGMALRTPGPAAPIVGVTTLQALAAGSDQSAPHIAAIDARRGQIYAQAFNADAEPLCPPFVATPEAAAQRLADTPQLTNAEIVGTGAALLAPLLPDARLSMAPAQCDAAIVAALAARAPATARAARRS